MAKESDRDLNPQQAQRNGQSAISQDNPLRELHQEGDAQSDRTIGSAPVTPELTDEEVSVLCDVERDGSTKSDKQPVVQNLIERGFIDSRFAEQTQGALGEHSAGWEATFPPASG